MTTELEHLTRALGATYRIERELGAGGMATVYLAHDLKHERDVALKLLREDLSASIGAGRFLREIKIAAQLQHPNILPLLDSGEADGRLYFVMPYVKGQSLRERLARDGELPVHEAVRLLTEIVDALAEAHSHGVVHRDIKPDNVMLSGRHALVTDFGVAKAISEATGQHTVTTLGIAVGTPTYMSPEQAVADPHVDHRSDIYAVGVVAYEMLTGQPPFTGGSPQQVLAAHVTATPDLVSKHRAAVPAALVQIVARCLEKRPSDRFQSAGELLAALEPLATPSTGITPAETAPVARGGRRPKWIVPAGAAAVIAAIAVGGFAFVKRGGSTVTRAAALERVQLTTSGRARSPVLSPDGKLVVYTERSCAADTLPCKVRLVMQDVATGARQPVSDTLDRIVALEWSTTGAWLLVRAADAAAGENVGLYVMSHLGGPRVPMGYVATFSPTGDTVVSLGDGILRGRKAVTARSYVAPWTLATDSLVLSVPDSAILVGRIALSTDRRWLAATWELAGQRNSVLTIHDQAGRAVASRTLENGAPLGVWSGSSLLRPVLVGGQGGIERMPVDPRTGALGSLDTLMLGANSALPPISRSTDGLALAFGESHGGESALSTLESASATRPYRVARRVLADPSLNGAQLSPDGATVVYAVTVAAGSGRRDQLLVMPFVGGTARLLAAPYENLVNFAISADSRRITVATGDGPGRARLASYDLASGREVASARWREKVVRVFSTSVGPGILVDGSLVFLDSSLTQTKRVAIPVNLGAVVSDVMSSSTRPAAAASFQPLDLGSTFGPDRNFHTALYTVDTSGRFSRAGEDASWNVYGHWWLADGSFRLYGNLGTDQRFGIYRMGGADGTQRLVGLVPFHDMLEMSLSADGRRGVVVTRPEISDVWLVRNFGAVVQR